MRPQGNRVTTLPRGNYVAHVRSSDIQDGVVTLRLVCAGHGRMFKARAEFRAYQRDLELQQRERDRMQCLVDAAGVERLTDATQLYGIPFRLTVWGSGRWTFRPYCSSEKPQDWRKPRPALPQRPS
jgi:hypothetical protein